MSNYRFDQYIRELDDLSYYLTIGFVSRLRQHLQENYPALMLELDAKLSARSHKDMVAG